MLTRDLVRYRVRDGRVEPFLLRPTPAVRAVAEDLLLYWRSGIGRSRGELDEAEQPLLHRARSLVMARGLHKLIVDACDFADPADVGARRRDALLASAARLTDPAATAIEHRQAVADACDVDAEVLGADLYGDLPHAARLVAAPEWSVEELIDRYNLATVQGLLLRADALEIALDDRDPGTVRRVLKALRFHRLLAEVRAAEAGIQLSVSGPASVLGATTRYGLQLAAFLPALACARHWRASAVITEFQAGSAMLTIDDQTGLRGRSGFTGYVPEELRALRTVLAGKCPDWQLDDEPAMLVLPGGEVVVPDLAIAAAGAAPVQIELFHRWHHHPLQRRLEQLAEGVAPRLVIGVDRALAKRTAIAPLLEAPVFAERGFLFSGFPTQRALRQILTPLLDASLRQA